MFRTPSAGGLSLLEMLLVVGISSVLIAGVTTHLRTLGVTAGTAHQRREALQNSRVAIDRLTRQMRNAQSVTAISPAGHTQGSISLRGFNGDTHIFALRGTELYYGTSSADTLLATGIQSLAFAGYDPDGTVPPTEPERIDAVAIDLTAVLAGAADTVRETTRVRLASRTHVDKPFMHSSDASLYTKTTYAGIIDYWKVDGTEPDDEWAQFKEFGGGRYKGFNNGGHTGDIHAITLGFRCEFEKGGLGLCVRHNSTTLFYRIYTSSELDSVKDKKIWWWFDLTPMRTTWTGDDIPALSIEVWDPTYHDADVKFDTFVLRAIFGPAQASYFWADREGSDKYDKEWLNPSYAFGTPDGLYATGGFGDDKKHSLRATVPDRNVEIFTVESCVRGYVSETLDEGCLILRNALGTEGGGEGVEHFLHTARLNRFVGPSNQGDILVDVTRERPWTWADLNALEHRIYLDKDTDQHLLKADAVGWRVVHAPAIRRIAKWSE